jgi:phage shock protein PspC (stress-responsive transcriptional regulator)
MVRAPGGDHDGDMNESHTAPGTPPGTPPGPASGFATGTTRGQQSRPRPRQDLDGLRRSTDDQYIAGVAGGLGRHFGIDPTIVRVLLVVLTFFGGAGVLIYGVCWLFVPEEGSEKAPIRIGGEPRKLILLAVAGIAFLLAMGDAFSGFNAGWPITGAAIVVAVVLIVRERKEGRTESRAAQAAAWAAARDAGQYPPAPYGTTPSQNVAPVAQTAPYAAPEHTAVLDAPYSTGSLPPVPPVPPAPPAGWQPPPPLVPPRPKRTGVIWFWPTLALIAIGLGTLGVIDAGSTDVVAAAYPALAVGITGVMLLVGSFWGRPGGLIFLGFLSTFALTVATVVGSFNFDGRSITVAPTTAAEVQSSYTVHNGRIELDLSKVTDSQSLAGRSIDVSLKAGEIIVYVPRSLNVDIDAALAFAGGIKVPGYDGGGIQQSVSRHLSGIPVNTNPSLDLELDATVGQITVERR